MRRLPKFLLLFFVIIIMIIISMVMLRKEIQSYLFINESIGPTKNIIMENWSGDYTMFKDTRLILQRLGYSTISSIIEEDAYKDYRRKKVFLSHCQVAGIDSGTLRLIQVKKKSPNTLNNAITVIDTVRNLGWDEFTLITPFYHSSRSKRIYNLVAKPYNIHVQVVSIPSYYGITAENWYSKRRGWMMIAIELVSNLYYELMVYPRY
jgi:hypothetical protein